MSKHTKGPWEVELVDDGEVSGCTFTIRMASALEGNGYEPQHRIDYEAPSEEESPEQFTEAKANANLIIASPDLFDALRQLRIDANRLCDRQLGGTYEDDCRRSIATADAAIKKALGLS